MGAALGWGAVAASSLVLGALLGLIKAWPSRAIGLVLAFGAGALISAVSFELAEEGIREAGARPVAIGLSLGALTYFLCVLALERRAPGGRAGARGAEGEAGVALALGAFLDGIPEQLVLGLSVASGDGVSLALLAAIYVSNLPEALGSASDMRVSGYGRRHVAELWIGVAIMCALASVAGYAVADAASGDVTGTINGFAAGALLVMLIDSMIPEARRTADRPAGLMATLGFALGTGLSTLTT